MQLMQKPTLTIEEVKLALDFISSEIRNNLDVNTPSTRLCKESSCAVEDLCYFLAIPCIQFCTSELGVTPLEHHFGILGFKTEQGQICFLVDLTYIQFSLDKYNIDAPKTQVIPIISPGKFMDEAIKEELIKNGYLTLTEENITQYINGFINGYKSLYIENQNKNLLKLEKINEQDVFNKLYNLFKKYHINVVAEDCFGQFSSEDQKLK